MYLQVGREWVRKPHVAWEGTQDEVAELDAVWWNNITEAIMVVTQELWEVMQQDQKHTERALQQQEDGEVKWLSPAAAPPPTLYRICIGLLSSTFLRNGARYLKRSMSSCAYMGQPFTAAAALQPGFLKASACLRRRRRVPSAEACAPASWR